MGALTITKFFLSSIFVIFLRVYSIEWTVEGLVIQDADTFGAPLSKLVKDFARDHAKRSALALVPKRRVDSNSVIKLITSGARHIFSDGKVSVYRKKGSYTKALEDFDKTNPKNVRDLIYDKEAGGDFAQLHKMGVIGSRRIYVGMEKSSGAPLIAISRAYRPEMLERVIIYRH